MAGRATVNIPGQSENGGREKVGIPGALTVNELGLVNVELADLQFTVGGLGGAVTAGKVVDDDAEDLVAGDALDGGLETGERLARVTVGYW